MANAFGEKSQEAYIQFPIKGESNLFLLNQGIK